MYGSVSEPWIKRFLLTGRHNKIFILFTLHYICLILKIKGYTTSKNCADWWMEATIANNLKVDVLIRDI